MFKDLSVMGMPSNELLALNDKGVPPQSDFLQHSEARPVRIPDDLSKRLVTEGNIGP